MTKIIVEIGANHGGDMDLAKEMVTKASLAGADIVKFQVWSIDNLIKGPWDNDGRLELYKQSQLSKEKIAELYEFCSEKGIKFLVSVFNKKDLALLPDSYTDIIKIPSTEIDNISLLEACRYIFDDIILSVGSSTMDEIDRAYSICTPSCIMHCVNMYPCPFEDANLNRIDSLKRWFPSVGYSDHTIGLAAPVYAISHGCEYVEKHFTIDRDLPGRDNQFSIMTDELRVLCSIRDQIHTMTQTNILDYVEGEKEMREIYRGRWGR